MTRSQRDLTTWSGVMLTEYGDFRTEGPVQQMKIWKWSGNRWRRVKALPEELVDWGEIEGGLYFSRKRTP